MIEANIEVLQGRLRTLQSAAGGALTLLNGHLETIERMTAIGTVLTAGQKTAAMTALNAKAGDIQTAYNSCVAAFQATEAL